MLKYLLIAGIAIIGLHSSYELDEIVRRDGVTRMVQPINDSAENAGYFKGLEIDSVVFLYNRDCIAYMLECSSPQGTTVVDTVSIDEKEFPNWRMADSLEGIVTRYTDTWNEMAKPQSY